jgi:hypothetical protein
MKRRDVLRKLKTAANRAGLGYDETELTNHTGVTIDGYRSTLGRHNEIDDVTARKFWDQFADVLGKGWWR